MGLTAVNIAFVALAILAAAAQQELQAQVSIARTVQYQGLLPVVGNYVRYEITITNTGSLPITGQKMWADFSPAGEQEAGAVFAVPEIPPGKSTQMHVGPFKMHAAGEHVLALGMNGQGDRNLPDDVALNITGQVDAVTAYSPTVAETLPVGMGLAFAGAGFIAWHFARRKRDQAV